MSPILELSLPASLRSAERRLHVGAHDWLKVDGESSRSSQHSSDQLALGGDGNHDQIFRDPASPVFRGAESPEELIAGRSLPGQFAETGPLRFVED